ncbi:hypothetical protein U1Q18_042599 [Sarracenia purpurea var. burkii]
MKKIIPRIKCFSGTGTKRSNIIIPAGYRGKKWVDIASQFKQIPYGKNLDKRDNRGGKNADKVRHHQMSQRTWTNRGVRFCEGPFTVRLEKRENGNSRQDQDVIASYGGWVAVDHLPLNLWNYEVFCSNGENCRGLINFNESICLLRIWLWLHTSFS